MIVRMHQLMRQRILHVVSINEPVLTQQNPIVRIEPAGLEFSARQAPDVALVQLSVRRGNVFEHEPDYRACAREG